VSEKTTKNALIFEEETFAIRGAAFDVYKELSNGFLESVYQECLEKEMLARNIPFLAQPTIRLTYKGQLLQQMYKPDLICYDKIIVELKVAKEISAEHKAQVINYLKATGYKVGMLLNFGHYPQMQIERFVL